MTKSRLHAECLLSLQNLRAGIIAPALDALVETVRLQTLSKGALHQVQVDACALKELFLRWTPHRLHAPPVCTA